MRCAELEARSIPVKDGRWGYRLLVVEDLLAASFLRWCSGAAGETGILNG